MLTVENVEVYGFEPAIRGMRNPMNSWDKSDSYDAVDCGKCGLIEEKGFCRKEERLGRCDNFRCYAVGDNDLKLMQSLFKAGTEHRKYDRMIQVWMDIEAPLYWWKEFDTYKVGTVANSCSTMHKIADKEFTLDDFSHEHLTTTGVELLEQTIDELNDWRDWYIRYDEYHSVITKEITSKKHVWWQMIQLLPSSYNQKRTVMLNYEVLANIYKSRKDHKLDEWLKLCEWIETLPCAWLFTGEYDE